MTTRLPDGPQSSQPLPMDDRQRHRPEPTALVTRPASLPAVTGTRGDDRSAAAAEVDAASGPPTPSTEAQPGSPAPVSVTAAFHRFRNGASPAGLSREVAVEAPVSLVYSGLPFAVMMATPCDLQDFALGFSLTEGIVEGTGDLRGISVGPDEAGGTRVDLTLTGAALRRHLARQRGRPGRVITGRTGCGICGVEEAGALPWAAVPDTEAPVLRASSIRRALDALEDAQVLNRRTNAVHAAAWVGLDGTLLLVREDVGRHNALDKLVGAVTHAGLDRLAGFVLVTSRCSYEMVEKTAVLGARALVSISLPTSLALERARALGMTLVAGARGDVLTVFHGADRVTEADPAP